MVSFFHSPFKPRANSNESSVTDHAMSSASPNETTAVTTIIQVPATPTTPPTNCHQCEICAHHEALLCRYAGKKCRNPRAMKRNGSLHNLCDHHCIRANQNQRRMAHQSRMKQAQVQV